MRLFIAIQLDPQMKEYLSSVQDQFRDRNIRGNFTPEENFHLTLAFIGEYPRPEDVLDVIREVEFEPFGITLDQVGCFDNLWWIGLKENPTLTQVVKRLRYGLTQAGIPFDKKRFKAHITLLRRADYAKGQIGAITSKPICMKVDRICLMRSTRGKHGMIYTEIN
ncbi:MAG: RNA 2',3'-cyclic phosphodiesterase [Firmicutes bacterium]|nr:RNA 2',3'-cyclic phosphodiesterase [Bacillota bacterium]